MKGHECFHCKRWIPAGAEHDCWTTTERALTKDLPEDLQAAWERLRETAVEFGEQRIYASHHSIMFSRQACYFFVRPRRNRLEVVFFLGRALKLPLVQKVLPASKTKLAHLVHVVHRDQVEPPMTDWLREAYELQDRPSPEVTQRTAAKKAKPLKPRRRAKLRSPSSRR